MPGSVVNVVVTTLLGVKVPLAVDSGITGGELKDLVRQKAEVPKQFRIGFKSVGLAAKRALSEAGIPDGAEIWMSKSESPPTLSGHAQALGRTARGVQNGSIKHAIVAVGSELARVRRAIRWARDFRRRIRARGLPSFPTSLSMRSHRDPFRSGSLKRRERI